MILKSTLTCPKCGYKELLKMPEDKCIYFHNCSNCNELLKPLPGDCCVYCSYGDVPCPSIQEKSECCE